MDFMIIVGLMFVGSWLGWSISMDFSNLPILHHANTAFVGFWTFTGLILGYVVGKKISDLLRHHFYLS